MAQYSPERIRAVVRWLSGQTGKKQQDIGRELGYSDKTAFSAVINGKATVPARLPMDLAALDPRINLDYLLGKSDDMLLGSASAGSDVVLSGAAMELLSDMMATIRSQQETIRLQQETILRGTELQKKTGGNAG